MKKNLKKDRLKRRLPLEVALRLRRHEISPQKGEKRYNRKKIKAEFRKMKSDYTIDENY